MKRHKKTIFTLIIFMTILSITFNPFSAKAAPLMLNISEPQVDQLYIGDDYITGKLQQEVPMHYPGNAAYVLFNNKQYYITDYTVENDVNFRLKLPKTLEAGDTLNYLAITGDVLDPVAYPGQESYKMAGPFTPIEKANIQVNYVNEANQTLAPSDTFSGKIGETYTTSPKTIDGYQVKETPTNATGTYTTNTETIQVNYVYEKTAVEGANVTVDYIDEATNESIAPTETLSGKMGETFQAEVKEIDGYELSEMPSNQSGIYTDQTQSVIFKYKKITTPVEVAKDVTVTYKDTEGNQLAEPVILKGDIGSTFETETKSFKGYKLTKTPVNHAGLFTNETQEVAYVYSKDSEVVAPIDPSKPPTNDTSTDLIVSHITDNAIKSTNKSIKQLNNTPAEKPFKPSGAIQLPKTGDTNNNLLVFIGFILLVGGTYIIISRKIAK
ncbi:TPA_asm: LPXTG cell wall anchor domain-containing protein [Listeria innocua]|uniref:MucBP domain-containing protein n=1 Tax=Listeria innocua TaxID=1642 RepID=UPI0016283036|nr:MucBP domain-containing protein [Listeria innocua]MBC1414850.1 LPXTG cell wall anchor domain-containing protein [Listeria innocua]HAC3176491.1 LPXTG cell wall anchor domain-containing protein [Listeria innocua]